jgi:hypothetical protein
MENNKQLLSMLTMSNQVIKILRLMMSSMFGYKECTEMKRLLQSKQKVERYMNI